MAKQQAPVVPARSELKEVVLSRNSRANELGGREPGFVYEAFSTEPDHPSYIGNKLRPHEIGDQSSGFAVVRAWEPVQDALGEQVRSIEPRTDQGLPVDSLLRYGRQIVCRLPEDEHRKYAAVHEARRRKMKQMVFGTPDATRERGVSMTAVVSESEITDPAVLLKQAGHPMPGG